MRAKLLMKLAKLSVYVIGAVFLLWKGATYQDRALSLIPAAMCTLTATSLVLTGLVLTLGPSDGGLGHPVDR